MNKRERLVARKQLKAYQDRAKIKVGDKFLWRSGNEGYITSGSLSPNYMWSNIVFPVPTPLTVTEVFTGQNGYGNFVDYELETRNGRKIRINGPDAFKMERVV